MSRMIVLTAIGQRRGGLGVNDQVDLLNIIEVRGVKRTGFKKGDILVGA